MRHLLVLAGHERPRAAILVRQHVLHLPNIQVEMGQQQGGAGALSRAAGSRFMTCSRKGSQPLVPAELTGWRIRITSPPSCTDRKLPRALPVAAGQAVSCPRLHITRTRRVFSKVVTTHTSVGYRDTATSGFATFHTWVDTSVAAVDARLWAANQAASTSSRGKDPPVQGSDIIPTAQGTDQHAHTPARRRPTLAPVLLGATS